MIGSVERYSSSTRKRRVSIFSSRTLRIVLIALILYLIVSRFFVSTFRIESVSMNPTLKPADKVLASVLTFGARIPFTESRFPALFQPARGDIVVVQPPYFNDDSALKRVFEPFVSFFTLQRATLYRDPAGERAQGYVVKRVIGIPGDTIRLRGFLASIRPRGAPEFINESNLIGMGGKPLAALAARNWQPEFPFSGNSQEITLKDDEYFVLGDNRPDSSDSRSWGPIPRSRIIAKVILRFWPPRDFGKL
jgi:signal peptidase I